MILPQLLQLLITPEKVRRSKLLAPVFAAASAASIHLNTSQVFPFYSSLTHCLTDCA
jgi:hypothetical protein